MSLFSSSDRPDRPNRRRDDSDGSLPLLFEVESFEFVPAGDGVGLLRLTGAWSADPERLVAMPIEVEIERDGEAVRLPVLPDPSAPLAVAVPAGEPWRGAFMTETELAEDPRADFALAAGGQVVAGLPRPGDFEILDGHEDGAAEEDTPAAEAAGAVAEPLAIDLDDLVSEHVRAREVAEARAEAADQRAGAAESTLTLLSHEIETLRSQNESLAHELGTLRVQAEAAAAGRAEAATAVERERTRHQAAESELRGELEGARRELASATAEIERARADLAGAGTDRDAEIHELRSELARERERAEHESERSTEQVQRKLDAVHEHLQQAREELAVERRRASTMEEELRTQAALERQLRDTIAGREAELAAAELHEARLVQSADRRSEPEERVSVRQSHEVQDDFFARIEQAKRLSETSS
jgi:hypothetical protein